MGTVTASLDQLWIRKLAREIIYVVRFFTVRTEPAKPQPHRENVRIQNRDGSVQVKPMLKPFRTKEDYLSTHIHTKLGLSSLKTFLFK